MLNNAKDLDKLVNGNVRLKIGRRLRDLRKERNLTQIKVAEILGVSNSTLSQYEASKRVPDYTTLSKFSEIYDVSTDYMLGITDFRIRFDDIKSARKEIQGIETLKRQAPDLYQALIILCRILDKEQIEPLSAMVIGYLQYYRNRQLDRDKD